MDDRVISAMSGALSHALSTTTQPRPSSRQIAEAVLWTLEQTGFYMIAVPDYLNEYVLEPVDHCTCGNYRPERYGHEPYCGVEPDYGSKNKQRIIEQIARNIVYQIGDLLDVPVEKRQATNDTAIDFVKHLLGSL